jgi:hypothetical protein
MNRQKLTIVLLIAACAIGACGRNDSSRDSAPQGSAVSIAQITPSTSVALRVGDKVALRVEVDYALSVDSGTVTLVVQSSDNTPISSETEVVTKGSGKVVLNSTFVVPDTRAVQVFTPLSAQGQASTSTIDSRAYKVEPR